MARDPDRGRARHGLAGTDLHRAGDVADMVNDLYRLDCDVWGHPLDAAVLRCVAATEWKQGQSARVRAIANTLGVSVATVHNRLKRLCEDASDDGGKSACVIRDPNGRYRLNATGRQLMQEYIVEIARTVSVFARRRDACSICQLAQTAGLNPLQSTETSAEASFARLVPTK